MKRKLQFFVCTFAASILAVSVPAQHSTKTKDESASTQDRMVHPRSADQLNDVAKSSDIIGMTVKNYQNEKLGKVEELAVDVESGRVIQVILSVGGFLGVGDTLTAVPPGALHHLVADKVLHLDANKEKLKSAPKFEMSKWAEYSNWDNLSGVYRYYGEEASLSYIKKGDAVSDARTANQGWIPTSRLAHVQKASKIVGTSVKNMQDEKLGKVENILVDIPSGRIVALVISSGGFLGIGDELSAVPPSALRFTPDRDTLQLDTTKEALSKAPHFNAKEWPEMSQPSYVGEVYRAYGVQPYFNTDADNTARNVRDRSDSSVTPLDQGNNKADLNTTAQIRKEIIAAKNMSVNARNVKIVTVNGHVTLRGPVKTEEEKRVIGEIAARIAQPQNVENQLEVNFNTSSN